MKVCVLTYIFGDYEILREVTQPDEDFEYICVTDNKDLTSKTWKIIQYEGDYNQNSWFKTLQVRYSPFKYTQADIVITIDGSMQIYGSLKQLVKDFIDGEYFIGTLVHPLYTNVKTDIKEELRCKRYQEVHARRTLAYFNALNYDYNFKGYYLAGLLIRRNDKAAQIFNSLVIQNINYVSLFEGGLERTDQFQLTFVLNTYFKYFKIMPLSIQCVCNDIIQQFKHKSTTEKICNIKYNINVPEYVYCQNKRVQSYFLKKGND